MAISQPPSNSLLEPLLLQPYLLHTVQTSLKHEATTHQELCACWAWAATAITGEDLSQTHVLAVVTTANAGWR